MIYITRKEQFNAAHKLWREEWSEEQNTATFGPCSNPNWHGHNYDLYVTVKGTPDPVTSFVVDLKLLSKIIKRQVIDKVDHKNLNVDVEFMKGVMSSTENLAIKIWDELEGEINALGCKLHCIKLYETERNYVEYYGEKEEE